MITLLGYIYESNISWNQDAPSVDCCGGGEKLKVQAVHFCHIMCSPMSLESIKIMSVLQMKYVIFVSWNSINHLTSGTTFVTFHLSVALLLYGWVNNWHFSNMCQHDTRVLILLPKQYINQLCLQNLDFILQKNQNRTQMLSMYVILGNT